MTHFGASEDVDWQLAEVGARLDRIADMARDLDSSDWIEAVRSELRAASSPEVYDAYLQAAPTDQAYAGLRRYWDKRQATADAAGAG